MSSALVCLVGVLDSIISVRWCSVGFLTFVDCICNRYKKKQHAQIVEKGQKTSDKLHYITQLDGFGNACGSIAALHSVANSLDMVPLAADGLLAKFIKLTGEAPKPLTHLKLIMNGRWQMA